MRSHGPFFIRLALAAAAAMLATRVQAGAECVQVYCACDSPGVYQPCGTNCAAWCARKAGGGAIPPALGDYKHQLMMEATSKLVGGLLESIFSSDTSEVDARLAEERRRLAEEEARRAVEAAQIAEAKRQRLISELKGFRRVELAYKGRPPTAGAFKREGMEELAKAAALCGAGLSDEALDVALASDSGVSVSPDAVRRVNVTAEQARDFAEVRRESQRATREDDEARRVLADAEAGLNAMRHALNYAREEYERLSAQKKDSSKAGRTLEETRAYTAKVEERARSAQAGASAAQGRLARAQARQREFACDPAGWARKKSDRKEDWCKEHPRPLRPSASVLEVGRQDEARWAAYVERMKEWCPRCAQGDGGCEPDPGVAARRPLPRDGDSATSQGPFGKNDPPCGGGFLTAPMGGDFFSCCPEGQPYLSRCDRRCYSADAFNGDRIQCDDSWSGTIRSQ
jgi:hypothetical protein